MTSGWTVDPSLRFGCVGCTACCRGWLVQLDQRFLERFDEAALRQAAPPLPPDLPLFVREPGSGPDAPVYLAQRERRCVMLEADGGCRIHRVLGLAAKPETCRQYPLLYLRQPTGGRIALRCSCCGSVACWESGPLVAAELPRLLAEPGFSPHLDDPRRLTLVPGRELTGEPRQRWLSAARAVVDGAVGPFAALRGLAVLLGQRPAPATDAEVQPQLLATFVRLLPWLRTLVLLEQEAGEEPDALPPQPALFTLGRRGVCELRRALDARPPLLLLAPTAARVAPELSRYLRHFLGQYLEAAEYRPFPDLAAALGSLAALLPPLLWVTSTEPPAVRLSFLGSTLARLLRSVYPAGVGLDGQVLDDLRACLTSL